MPVRLAGTFLLASVLCAQAPSTKRDIIAYLSGKPPNFRAEYLRRRERIRGLQSGPRLGREPSQRTSRIVV